jgi:hypothetical protein
VMPVRAPIYASCLLLIKGGEGNKNKRRKNNGISNSK